MLADRSGNYYRGLVGSAMFLILPCVSPPCFLPWVNATRVWVWGLQNQREINKKKVAFPFVLGDSTGCTTLIRLSWDTVLRSTSLPSSE